MIPISKGEWEVRLKKLYSLPGYAEMDSHVEPDKMKGFVHQWHQNKHAEPQPECVFCMAQAEPVETIYTKKQKFALKVCHLRSKYREGTLSQKWIEALKTVGFDFNRGYSDHWRPFAEAREFVRALKLQGWKEWWAYCKTGQKPADIPANPSERYEDEWRGANDWFGTGRRHSRTKSGWRPFKKARAFARSLGFKSQTEWADFAKTDKKPEDIPAAPASVYEKRGWAGIGDWLGYASQQRGRWRAFEEARTFVRTLGLKNELEWRDYCMSGKKPADIPATPHRVYKNEWVDVPDWIGFHYRGKGRWKSFEEARAFTRSLGLKSGREWKDYTKSGALPHDIPSHPHRHYAEYQGLGDWLDCKIRKSPSK